MLREVSSRTCSLDRVDWAEFGLYAHKWIIDGHDEHAFYILQLWAVDVAG